MEKYMKPFLFLMGVVAISVSSAYADTGSPCDIGFANGGFAVFRDGSAMSEWNKQLGPVIKTRDSLIDGKLCERRRIGNVSIAYDDGHYAVTRDGALFSAWTRDYRDAIDQLDQLFDNRVADRNDNAVCDLFFSGGSYQVTLGGIPMSGWTGNVKDATQQVHDYVRAHICRNK
jgi:hypothetical protein